MNHLITYVFIYVKLQVMVAYCNSLFISCNLYIITRTLQFTNYNDWVEYIFYLTLPPTRMQKPRMSIEVLNNVLSSNFCIVIVFHLPIHKKREKRVSEQQSKSI